MKLMKIKRRNRLEQDISSLEASADVLLNTAETSHSIKYVTEANSLRRTVKQKAVDLKNCGAAAGKPTAADEK